MAEWKFTDSQASIRWVPIPTVEKRNAFQLKY